MAHLATRASALRWKRVASPRGRTHARSSDADVLHAAKRTIGQCDAVQRAPVVTQQRISVGGVERGEPGQREAMIEPGNQFRLMPAGC